MKKKIALVLVLCIMTAMLCGCSKVYYKDANSKISIDFSNGYFTPIKEWGTYIDSCYQQLVYATTVAVSIKIETPGFFESKSFSVSAATTLNLDGVSLCASTVLQSVASPQ